MFILFIFLILSLLHTWIIWNPQLGILFSLCFIPGYIYLSFIRSSSRCMRNYCYNYCWFFHWAFSSFPIFSRLCSFIMIPSPIKYTIFSYNNEQVSGLDVVFHFSKRCLRKKVWRKERLQMPPWHFYRKVDRRNINPINWVNFHQNLTFWTLELVKPYVIIIYGRSLNKFLTEIRLNTSKREAPKSQLKSGMYVNVFLAKWFGRHIKKLGRIATMV